MLPNSAFGSHSSRFSISSNVAVSLVPPLRPRPANRPWSESCPQTTPFNKRCPNLHKSWLCIWTALSPFAYFRQRRARARAKRGSNSKNVLNEHWQLGGWKLRGRVVLAPMEQVTDCAFRRLCFELGANFTWTEMVRAASLLKRNNSTTSRIDTFDPSTPTGGAMFKKRYFKALQNTSTSNFVQMLSLKSMRCIK